MHGEKDYIAILMGCYEKAVIPMQTGAESPQHLNSYFAG